MTAQSSVMIPDQISVEEDYLPIIEAVNYSYVSAKPRSPRPKRSRSPHHGEIGTNDRRSSIQPTEDFERLERNENCEISSKSAATRRPRSQSLSQDEDKPRVHIEGDSDHHGHPRNKDDTEPRSSKFRFKSKQRESRKRRSERDRESDDERRRRRRRREKHRRVSPDDPAAYDDTPLPNLSSKEYIDPDAAFRESLFQAMADDEGAQFWEGVYGQPIPFERVPGIKEAQDGSLEAMTEEEYAAHMRAEMYKKTHQHLIEEKERRDKAKKAAEKEKERLRRENDESERFSRKVEESLRRGKERKMRVQMTTEWTKRWNEYQISWSDLGRSSTKIPWPVFTGHKADIETDEVERFFLNAPTGGQPGTADLPKILKSERVRWHPDKVQQKLGGQEADEAKMKGVTAVFQIIDRLWSDVRR